MNTSEDGKTGRVLALWLFAVAAMVAAMVVIGGITRLTGSGLSMVEWHPVTGWLPPLTELEWLRAFALYQNSPEYLEHNSWMGLADFRRIFWWEYIHRLWGRLIGLAFGVPFLWFALRGQVRGWLALRLTGLLMLGGAQGVLGWWMVKSGLAEVPEVSPLRLTLHLGLAFLILAALIHTALTLMRAPRVEVPRTLHLHAVIVVALTSLTVLAGAVVAGLNAGLIYPSFPLMGDGLVPPEYGALSPFWRDLIESPATAQFHHRMLALITLAAVLGLLWRVIRSDLAPPLRLPVHLLGSLVLVQTALGIATLLAGVPIALAALHQSGAVVVFSLTIWVMYSLRRGA